MRLIDAVLCLRQFVASSPPWRAHPARPSGAGVCGISGFAAGAAHPKLIFASRFARESAVARAATSSMLC
ncbi:MAG: hypothetical protein ACREU3_02565, partial [Steroidobacteraceae bacterium]